MWQVTSPHRSPNPYPDIILTVALGLVIKITPTLTLTLVLKLNVKRTQARFLMWQPACSVRMAAYSSAVPNVATRLLRQNGGELKRGSQAPNFRTARWDGEIIQRRRRLQSREASQQLLGGGVPGAEE